MARLKRQSPARLLVPLFAAALVLVICLSDLTGTAQATSTASAIARIAATQAAAHSPAEAAKAVLTSAGGPSTLAPPAIHAQAAILEDMSTGQVLYSQNADAERPMASTTKIMTALLVLNTLSLDRVVTVSARAAKVGEQSLGLKAGDRLTVRQLLYGTLVYSANDAAFALAEACSGSMESFVKKMNQKAAQLGLSNTHYVNPDGLDAPGHYSSARDLAALARYAMKNAEFRKIVGTVSYSIALPGRSTPFVFRNVNKLLGTVSWVTGIKTGSTDGAGVCLVSSGTQNGRSVVSVVLGETASTPTWSDSKALLEYGFELEQLAATSAPLTCTAPLFGQDEIPAVSTSASGTLTLTVAADGSSVHYVAKITGLTVARLHEGKSGTSGATLLTLFSGPAKTGSFTGVLAQGSFTAANLGGPLEGKKVADLVALIKSGEVYINVGTNSHPRGEIRGQLK